MKIISVQKRKICELRSFKSHDKVSFGLTLDANHRNNKRNQEFNDFEFFILNKSKRLNDDGSILWNKKLNKNKRIPLFIIKFIRSLADQRI